MVAGCAVSEDALPRYAIASLVVVGHRRYGLRVEVVDSDREGFVDSANIADPPLRHEDWPCVGARMRGVVLGRTRAGQLRLTTRRRDVAFVESVSDPAGAFLEWRAVHAAGSSNVDARSEFFRSANASALLEWALKNSPYSENRKLAIELLSVAPDELRTQVLREE